MKTLRQLRKEGHRFEIAGQQLRRRIAYEGAGFYSLHGDGTYRRGRFRSHSRLYIGPKP
jgi:hypothetical protein